jgi:putative ABC transport system permease protein
MSMFRQSLRMTARDWRAGELRFLLVALVVAVAALSATGFLSTACARPRTRRPPAARRRPADQRRPAAAIRPGARSAAARPAAGRYRHFPSMAQAGEGEPRRRAGRGEGGLAGYPLRGQPEGHHRSGAGRASPARHRATSPAPGTVWVDANLLGSLKTQVGGELQLGDKRFKVAQLIASEPDRGASFALRAARDAGAVRPEATTGLIDNSRA